MSDHKPHYGLNQMVCPSYTINEFLDLADQLGFETVEFRNDVGDKSLTNLETAKAAGDKAKALGITVLSINALYPFNIWNDERKEQTEKMAQLAQGAGEDECFADRTGLIHISGLEDEISFENMLDGHRVLVGPADRLGNVEQLQRLLADGFDGPVSFEPFSERVWNLTDPKGAVEESISFVNTELSK